MFEFLKRKKKEEKEEKEEKKFEPREFKFYGEDAERLYRLWDKYVKVDTKEARYHLWDAIDRRVPDVNIAYDNWTIKMGNALVFKIIEDVKN